MKLWQNGTTYNSILLPLLQRLCYHGSFRLCRGNISRIKKIFFDSKHLICSVIRAKISWKSIKQTKNTGQSLCHVKHSFMSLTFFTLIVYNYIEKKVLSHESYKML